MKLKNTTSKTVKRYSTRFSIHDKVKIILEFCETGQELCGNSTYKGCPVGVWASKIRYCKSLCETHSISTIDDFVQLKNNRIAQSISINTLSRIKSYLSLTPEELLELDNANVLTPPTTSTDISIHDKVKLILEFCKTGQELTR